MKKKYDKNLALTQNNIYYGYYIPGSKMLGK